MDARLATVHASHTTHNGEDPEPIAPVARPTITTPRYGPPTSPYATQPMASWTWSTVVQTSAPLYRVV